MNKSSRQVHPILEGVQYGVGTWAWGDRLFWGYGHGYQVEDLRAVFQSSLAAGINFFDTAEVYGQGNSERLLGEFLQETDQPVKIATKFMPFPWRLNRRSLLRALRHSLKRLGRDSVELYQMHQPMPPVTIETWMGAMSEALQAGWIQAVGVSNYGLRQTERAYTALIQEGAQLASNQVEYHLLDRRIEKSGLLKLCQELGVAVIAYSPLAQGLLSGKYTPSNLPPGFRGGKYGRKFLAQIQPLVTALRKIGAEHAGKTPAQVALNWVMCKGTIVIPGAKNLRQAEENAEALGWELTEEEIAELDQMSDRVLAEV